MKITKIILFFYIVLHSLFMFYINLTPLNSLKYFNQNEFNIFGRFCIKTSSIIKLPDNIEKVIKIYSNLTGTDRGYEFFSPNVSNKSLKIIFISNEGDEIQILNSIESDVKLLTATYYINSFLIEKNLRDYIFSSICSRLFISNPSVKEVSVFLKISEFHNLRDFNLPIIEQKTILLSKIKRND